MELNGSETHSRQNGAYNGYLGLVSSRLGPRWTPGQALNRLRFIRNPRFGRKQTIGYTDTRRGRRVLHGHQIEFAHISRTQFSAFAPSLFLMGG